MSTKPAMAATIRATSHIDHDTEIGQIEVAHSYCSAPLQPDPTFVVLSNAKDLFTPHFGFHEGKILRYAQKDTGVLNSNGSYEYKISVNSYKLTT